MYKAKHNFLWYKSGEEISDELIKQHPHWKSNFNYLGKDETETVTETKDDLSFDLNGDGIVDKEDRSIAAKVLRSGSRKKGKRK